MKGGTTMKNDFLTLHKMLGKPKNKNSESLLVNYLSFNEWINEVNIDIRMTCIQFENMKYVPWEKAPAKAFCSRGERWYLVVPLKKYTS